MALVLGPALRARLGAVRVLVLVAAAAHREAADVAGGEDVSLCRGTHAVAADLAHLPAAAPPLLYSYTKKDSAFLFQDPPPAQMPPRNETALGTHPRGRRRSAQGRRGGGEEADGHVPAPRRLAFSNPLARREKEPDGLLCLYLSRAFFAGDDDIVAGGETPLLGGAVPGRRGDGDNRRRRKRRLGLVGWGRGAARASVGGGSRRPHMSAPLFLRGTEEGQRGLDRIVRSKCNGENTCDGSILYEN
jgi:hypothetical protein